MTTKTENHAEQNALGHAESIIELWRAYEELEAGAETADADGDEYTDADEVRERAQEMALEVSVRSDWHAPGDSRNEGPAEYKILLTTGGPALRLIGELDDHAEPRGVPTLQHQDWGTPWTDIDPDAEDWPEAAQWFVGCFYFCE